MLFLLGYVLTTTQVDFNKDSLLNGIIKHLQTTTDQFLDKIGIVTPTASSTGWTTTPPSNIFLDNSTGNYGYWSSNYSGNSWFQVYFHQNAVLITDYVIQAFDWDFLKEWETYCSLDNQRWFLIDHQKTEERPPLASQKNTLSYHIKEPLICRYFKLVQKGPRIGTIGGTGIDNLFIIHKLEFFGIFYNHSTLSKMFQTCCQGFVKFKFIQFAFISILIDLS